MMGGKGNNQYSNRAVGIRVQSSLYGQVVPYLAGRFRITPKLIWAGALAAKKVSSGKKSGGKKGGQTYTYSAPADFLLAHYPVQAIFAGWCNSDYWPVAVSRQRLVVGSGHVTIAPTGVLLGIAGVYLIDAYAAAFNDFGGDGPVGVSGTWNNPLWNEFWPCPDGSAGTTRRPYTYKWKPSDGNTVTIADASLAGKTVEVWVVTQIGTSRATNLPSSPQYSPTGGVGNADILTQLNLELERYLASGSEYASNPANKLPYNWVSGLGSTKFDMGNQPMFPQFQPEAQGAMDFWPEGGADPADIITDIVTSGKQIAADAPYAGVTIGVGHGLNINAFPGNTIPSELSSFLGDLTAMRNYCRAYKIMASVYQETQVAAKQVLEDLFEIANCAPVYSGSQLKAIPYCEVSAADNGGVFTAPTASGPVYDLDDTCFFYKSGEMPIQIDRQRQSAAKNVFKLGHVCDNSEPTNTRGDYNDDTTTEPEQRSIAEFGPRPADARQMRYVTKKSVARKVASVLVKRSAYIRNHYRFSLKAEFFWLEAMDLITLTDAKLGLNKQAVRLTSIKENFQKPEDGKDEGGWTYECEAEDFIYGMNLPTPTEYTTLSPYVLWSNADPGDINAPIFLEPPDSIAGSGNQLWIALSGGNSNWGGCVVWMSLDGIEYSDVGSVFAPTEMGILTAALATHADPDNTNQLKVNLTESLAELVSVSAADKDSLRSLCWVDGELVSFQNATQTGAFAYTLDTLRRGAYATPIGTHAINSAFVRLDENILKLPLKGSLVGKLLYFKFTGFNKQGGGAQTVDDVGPYTYTFLGHFNNFVQIVKNDAVFAPVLEVSGLTAKTPVHGVGGVGTAVLITKSDGSTRSLGPFADLTGLALSTDFACMYNPHTASIYTLTDSVQIAIAVGNGHIFFNIFTTPDNAGAGAGSGGGDGSGFGGCPEETMYVSDDHQAKDVDRGLVLDCLDKGWLPDADKPTSIFGRIRVRVAEWLHRWKRPIQWVASSVEPGIRLVTANGAELIISESTPVPTLENLELASIDDTNTALYAKGVQEGWHALTDVGNGLEWSKLVTVERVGMIRVRRFYVGGRNFKAGRVPGKWIFSHNVRLVGK